MPMTPRERVLAAINFEEPDRVPIDLGGHKASGIAVRRANRWRVILAVDGCLSLLTEHGHMGCRCAREDECNAGVSLACGPKGEADW